MLRSRLARHPGDNAPAPPHERISPVAAATPSTPHASSASRAAWLAAAAPAAAPPIRALQGAAGNRAAQRVMNGAQPAAARDVHASDAGTVQRKKKNPERERLERIHMWSERLQQDGLGGGDAIVLGQAFANTGVSIVTLQQFAPLLNQAWTAGELVTLIRKFVGADGGRALEDWVAFAIRRPDDPDAVAAAVRVGQVDWANAAAVFNTHNDRYRRTLLNLAG